MSADLNQALPVLTESLLGDLSMPPSSAEEYLLRVRLEADSMPKVMQAQDLNPRIFDKQQTKYMRTAGEFTSAPDYCLPKASWQNEVAADFVDLRQHLVRCSKRSGGGPARNSTSGALYNVPRLGDAAAWHAFCLGRELCARTCGQEAVRQEVPQQACGTPNQPFTRKGVAPVLKMITRFDQILTRTVLQYHAQWITDQACDLCKDLAQQAIANDSMQKPKKRPHLLSLCAAGWIFALLAHLDKPITSRVASMLCQLLRSLCKLRALHRTTDENDPGHQAETLSLGAINTLITVITHVFDQGGEDMVNRDLQN